ncbi:ead/Ea22-like family protein [Salmonella enterica]|nr:ead/Ea22-like family protein [Salmonella enterica]EDT6574203.1 ead/Ea22-like family protein [Salmonella enterica subsp. enterica]HBL9993783.1 ead/Ea22-like family protein [Salmonella enterica subsp. enterica serovar Hidalgo]EHK9168541.1 ead/Ea22-like family protein [Salmonella enterica]EHP5353146.1 ead/Ea22-like family protein [Salmonella enterica]
MSNIDKQALRERYSPKPVPKCHICGEEMTIQRISASRITYGCTGATYDDKGCHYAEGRSIADDHYEQSRVTVVDVSDPDVLALLDELEAETGYREGAFIACNRWHDKFRETEDKLECAERRIAELEAKLETADKLQDSAFRDGLKAGFSYGQTDDQSGFAQCMSAYSTRAGIGVKQQEDSVDSDVGRNQLGMVVAVHIGAGDFVKVKGQVFEVEETDFDDHDVTLWFVGGNALKCAAGCPVEVVSAPVAAIKVKG